MPLDRDMRPEPLAARLPPHDFRLEQALLGAILVDNFAYSRVADFLLPTHFADPLHGRVFDVAARLIDRNQVVDPRTLNAYFKDDDTLIAHGRPHYISELAAAAISIIDVVDYGRQIQDLATRRQLITIGEELVNSAFKPDVAMSAAGLIEETEAHLYGIASSGSAEDRLRDAKTSLDQTIALIDQAQKEALIPEADRKAGAVITGLAGLDSKVRLRPGNLVILAGAPSMGKSALADGIAEVNEERGTPGAIYCLEMSAEEWNQRRLARATNINTYWMDQGKLHQAEFDRIMDAKYAMERRPFWIDDSPILTPARLRSSLRRLKRKHGIRWALVDYIQLMQPDRTERRQTNRTEDVTSITRSLKQTAADLGIVLFAVSQISRQVDQRDDKRPQLSDLRESGSIEQDANIVMFVYRREYYLKRSKPAGKGGKPPTEKEESEHLTELEKWAGKGEVIVAKQRQGEAPITAEVGWDGPRTRFYNLGTATPGPAPVSAQEELL